MMMSGEPASALAEIGIVCVGTLLSTESEPERSRPAVGANCTVIVHESAGARGAVQLLVCVMLGSPSTETFGVEIGA